MAWRPSNGNWVSVTPEFSGFMLDKTSQKPVPLMNIGMLKCLKRFLWVTKNRYWHISSV